jgi:prevent-host-death family protein
MTTRTIPAGEFKAKCLALLDEVRESGEEIIVTKRGKPVARVVPAETETEASIRARLRGSIVYQGDLISPLDEEWEANS